MNHNYKENNPYSTRDEELRDLAQKKNMNWQKPKSNMTSKTGDLVFIPGGTFEMGDVFNEGDSDEKPVHSVTVSDFYMGRTEVTVAQYRAFCRATGRAMPKAPSWGWKDDHPIVRVTWDDANAYCRWAGGRLPTEAEWEYAARGGGKKVRFGNGQNVADPARINFDGRSKYKKSYSNAGVYRGKTTPVAGFAPNALELYDMSGNVWEWCSDWYDKDYYRNSPRHNPTGPSSGSTRVLRGGSWYLYPFDIRTTNRDWYNPDVRYNVIGFRIVVSASP